jgi:outer membrane protein
MNLKRHALIAVLAVAFSAFAPSVYAQVKIAVVDLQRALNETEDGRQAKAQLKKIFKQRQQKLDERQNELKRMKEDIEKQQKVLSREALEKKLEEYQAAFVELQSTYVEYQRELATKEGELTKVIIDRMQNILRRVGQSEGYTLIMERGEAGVMWVPANLDLTDVVIQRYNSGEGREGGGGEAAPTKRPAKQR